MDEGSERKSGFYWHVHHGVLLEWCYSYEERKQYIIEHKPASEQELRLRLFQPVHGTLPDAVARASQEYVRASQEYARASQEYVRASQECDRAWEKRDRASQECDRASQECDRASQEYARASQECDRAWEKRDRAREKRDRAREEYDRALEEHAAEIEALHEQECPDCPWDGQTIFPEKGD